MNWDVVLIVVRITLSASVAYFLYYAVSAFARPRFFLRELWIDRDGRPPFKVMHETFIVKLQTATLVIGGAVVGWFGSQGLTQAIPSSWGFYAEGGGWSSWKDFFAGIVAVVCGLYALAIQPEDPDLTVGQQRLFDEARDMLLALGKHHGVADVIKDRATFSLQRASQSFRGTDYEVRFWRHLLNELERQ